MVRTKSILKRLFSAGLAFAMILSVVMPIPMPAAFAETTDNSSSTVKDHAYRYFYYQLEPAAKGFYDAMYNAYIDGTLQKGGDYDLTGNGCVTEAQLALYISGNSQLLYDFGAARDAFQYDYPDVFWVDFSALSFRIGKDSNNNLKAYLGIERKDTYFLPGFTAENISEKITEYNKKADELAKNASEVEAGEYENPTKERVEYVHDTIAKNMIYKYEDQVSSGNARTAYDSLIIGEGVCEAYTRGFKAVMDRLDIPTICVTGVYKVNDSCSEPHIWNYVQADGQWYAVDVTMDDPTGKRHEWLNKNSGHETREYCLVGSMVMMNDHIASGIMSPANFEFSYPNLATDPLRGEVYYNDGNFKVRHFEDNFVEGNDGNVESGTVMVSYNGKNYTENKADGIYILARFGYMENGEWKFENWGYIEPSVYGVPIEDETYVDDELGHYMMFYMPHLEMVQFAATTMPPPYGDNLQDIVKTGAYYQGNPSLLSEKTREIQNLWYSGYKKPPYIATASPMPGTMTIGREYHVKVTYDQKLIETEDKSDEVGIKLLYTDVYDGSDASMTAEKYAVLKNFKWDKNCTVEFDFTPSAKYADIGVIYDLQVTGLIGDISGSEPMHINYIAGNTESACAYRSQGYYWNVFGKPHLIDNSDIDTTGWQGVDMQTGEAENNITIPEEISHRLMLVTENASPLDEQKLLKELTQGDDINIDSGDIKKSETYNIKLTLCKAQVLKTGQGVRVSVGFPAGYSYDSLSEGTTFKVYHYKMDDKGNCIGVEEIPVVITKNGLILTINSFSPFTIAAVDSSKVETDNSKSVVIETSEGGYVEDFSHKKLQGIDGILAVKSGSQSVTVKANSGMEIESITLGDKSVNVTDKHSQEVVLDYSSLGDNATQLYVSFINEKSEELNAEHKISTDIEILPTSIIMEDTNVVVNPGNTLSISPKVTELNGTTSYQWYKDGQKLNGETNKTLSKSNMQESDSGEYTLEATTTDNGNTVTAKSETVNVYVGTLTVALDSAKSMKHHETAQLTASVSPVNKNVEWRSDAEDIVSIDQAGRIVAENVGTANITASVDGVEAKCLVTVSKLGIEKVTINSETESVKLAEQESQMLSVTIAPYNATNTDVVWSSENEAIATVEGGRVTGMSEGKTKIHAVADGVDASIDVIVGPLVEAESITLDKSSLSLEQGSTYTLKATVLPENTTNKTIIWKSSDPSVASIAANGMVTALKEGTAVITVSCGKVTAACKVTVTAKHSQNNEQPSGSTVKTDKTNTPTVSPATRSKTQVEKDKQKAKNAVKNAKIAKLKVNSNAKKKISVSWKKISGVKGYQVQVSAKKNFNKFALNKFTQKKKITLKGSKIKSGKTYYVRVRAYSQYKNIKNAAKKTYGKWSKKLEVKVK